MSHVRQLLALSMLALALSACGSPIDEDRTAGGQTGGESKEGAPCDPTIISEDVSFDEAGPSRVSAAEAMASFGVEHSVTGTLEGRSATTFHATLSYSGRARAACNVLVIDVSLALRSDDGSFDEVVPAQLAVFAKDDAVLSASYASQAVQGSYRELLPTSEGRDLAIQLSFSPSMSGWISLEPGPAGGPSSVLAKF